MTLHFLDTKIDNYVISASLKSEPTRKPINRIPGSRLLISGLQCSASRTHVKSLQASPFNKRSGSLAW